VFEQPTQSTRAMTAQAGRQFVLPTLADVLRYQKMEILRVQL
jgi:hypothetical protein